MYETADGKFNRLKAEEEEAKRRAKAEEEDAKRLEAYKKTPAYKKEQQELAKKKLQEELIAKKEQELEAKRVAKLKDQCDLNAGKRFSDLLNGAPIINSLMIIGMDNAIDKQVGNSLDSTKNNFNSQIINVGQSQNSGKSYIACQERLTVYKVNRSKGERQSSCFSIVYLSDKEFDMYRGIESFYCSDDEKKIPAWIRSNSVSGFQ